MKSASRGSSAGTGSRNRSRRVAPNPTIVVHGGAGPANDERRAVCVAGCERAAGAGFDVLVHSGSALDAVEAAVRVLEDDPEFNAGYGSTLNRAGVVEVDACIMDGETLSAGAVAAVPWLRHPVSLARLVMLDGEHVLLAGQGALAFARERGIEPDPPESLITPRVRERYERELARLRDPRASGAHRSRSGGTVGACALDADGHLAAATSTGGLFWKRPGRIGDSPLPGAGTYADDRVGAVSATGAGEPIMRVVLAKQVLDNLRAGRSSSRAVRLALTELARRTGGEAGAILVTRDARLAHHTSTPRMPWAAVVRGRLSSGFEA